MSSFKKYATREQHEQGFRVDLEDGDFVYIAGPFSYSALSRENENRKEFIDSLGGAQMTQTDQIRLYARIIAAKIVSWSFEEDLTRETAIDFVEASPEVLEKISAAYEAQASSKKKI